MAEEKKPIKVVTTFTADLAGLTLEESLKKSQGRRTLHTVAAARRIAVKPHRVKLPRNLLRQLFRLIGGFDPTKLKPSTDRPTLGEQDVSNGWQLRCLKIGDMEVVISTRSGYDPGGLWIIYRGRPVATVETYYFFKDKSKANGAATSLGVPYTPGEKK